MVGRIWKALPGLRREDWRSKLIAIAQVAVGFVTLLSLFGMLTRDPLLLLGFTAAQGLLLLGVVLFVVVAIFSQRTATRGGPSATRVTPTTGSTAPSRPRSWGWWTFTST